MDEWFDLTKLPSRGFVKCVALEPYDVGDRMERHSPNGVGSSSWGSPPEPV